MELAIILLSIGWLISSISSRNLFKLLEKDYLFLEENYNLLLAEKTDRKLIMRNGILVDENIFRDKDLGGGGKWLSNSSAIIKANEISRQFLLEMNQPTKPKFFIDEMYQPTKEMTNKTPPKGGSAGALSAKLQRKEASLDIKEAYELLNQMKKDIEAKSNNKVRPIPPSPVWKKEGHESSI